MKYEKQIVSGVKIVFYALFAYSSYNKLKSSLSITRKETKRSFKLIPEKGVLGTAEFVSKGSKD